MVTWSVIILGILSVAAFGIILMRRKEESETNPSHSITNQHQPCPTCGGPAHEAINNGNKWTWCPSCRKWLTYIGKE